ncbi:MAG: methyltransferase domain-containing protein [Thaumarchaeota archaeon]|nr:methyltransferase domain-containing protein [Nitrososphaerota archaeon]
MNPDTEGIACCFDERSQRHLDDFRQNGLSDTATEIRSALRNRGIAGKTILELGCGVGGFTLTLLKDGATSARGIDLSPRMVEAARSLAAEEGLSGSVSFEVGDGAKTHLDRADLVVLDAVICCYPDFSGLVQNSSFAARLYYAVSMPDDNRIATRLLRLVLPLQGIIFRRDSFRFFIHSKKQVVAQLEKDGFKLLSEIAVGWVWSVLMFAAPSN